MCLYSSDTTRLRKWRYTTLRDRTFSSIASFPASFCSCALTRGDQTLPRRRERKPQCIEPRSLVQSNGKGAPIGKQIPNPDPPNRGSHWPITCCDSERPVPPALASRLMSRSSEPRFPTQVSALRTRRRNCTKGWRAPQERPGNAQVRWSRRRIAVASPQVRKRQG